MALNIESKNDEPQALYRHYDADGRLLYVGITNDPGKRWESHRDKEWWHHVCTTKIERFPDRESVEAAERKAISTELPIWNSQYGTANRIDRKEVWSRDPHPIPPEWWPTEVEMGKARASFPLLDVESETRSFVARAAAKGKRRKDWGLAWKLTLREFHRQESERPPVPAPPGWSPSAATVKSFVNSYRHHRGRFNEDDFQLACDWFRENCYMMPYQRNWDAKWRDVVWSMMDQFHEMESIDEGHDFDGTMIA